MKRSGAGAAPPAPALGVTPLYSGASFIFTRQLPFDASNTCCCHSNPPPPYQLMAERSMLGNLTSPGGFFSVLEPFFHPPRHLPISPPETIFKYNLGLYCIVANFSSDSLMTNVLEQIFGPSCPEARRCCCIDPSSRQTRELLRELVYPLTKTVILTLQNTVGLDRICSAEQHRALIRLPSFSVLSYKTAATAGKLACRLRPRSDIVF